MATILAYTSPALGHLLPISALLSELSHRGHNVHMRTFSTGVEISQRLGFTADAIDPRIERIELDDWKATNPVASLKLSVAVFGRRAVHEVTDLAETVARAHPDALLVDVNCWGAQSAADAGPIPWACFSPYTPPLRSHGVPPFGLGLRPMSGAVGRMRDAAVRTAVVGRLEKVMLTPINTIRAKVNVGPVASMDEFLRRSPLLLVASGKPFQYPQTDRGDAVQMIGPCVLDPSPNTDTDWLASVDRPIVLVTTSSEKQADDNLVQTAMTALADEPVHVVATLPAGQPDGIATSPNATVFRYLPHGVVLDRAVCADTHWGWARLKRRSPVVYPCASCLRARPIRGRTARRGSRAAPPTGKKLSPPRLRTKVREAMTRDGWPDTAGVISPRPAALPAVPTF